MKVYIDSFGNIKKVLDNVFVANSTMFDNIITWYFVDDNGNVITNEEVSYCAMSMLRSDGHLISRINCPLTMTEEGYGYRYVCTQYDGILMVAGALQITAQFVKATIEDEEITDRETLCTTVVEGHVKINYGIENEEYFNDVLEQAMLDRDTLQAEITALEFGKQDVNIYDLGTYSSADLESPNYVVITEDLFNTFKSGKYQFIKYTDSYGVVHYYRLYDYDGSVGIDAVRFIGLTSANTDTSELTVSEQYLYVRNNTIAERYELYTITNESSLSIAGKQNTLTPDSVSTVPGANGSLNTAIGFTANGSLRKGVLKTINNEAIATRSGGNISVVPQSMTFIPDLSTSAVRADANIYVDADGTPSKISMTSLLGTFIREGASQPNDMQPGEFLFLEIGD